MGWRRRAEDREVARWRRELERLDDPDHLASAWIEPQRHQPHDVPAGPTPSGRGRQARRARGPLLPGLAVVLGLLTFVLLSSPSSTRYWIDEAQRRLSGEPSSSYAFMATGVAGQPTTWDRCEPIRFLVNPEDAPDGWEALVDDAAAEVSTASGFDVVRVGTTDEVDYLAREPGEPVLVGFGPASRYPALAGDVAGLGGASSVVGNGRARFVTGQVLLDSEEYGEMAARGDTEAMRGILVHEWLHVLGLDHVDDRHELMHPRYQGQDLGPGDREGLARLAAVPCG